MACARLDHIDHTAYMSFQFVGFSSSMNVSLRFRCPHLLQVSIKANPFVLFLVGLHLFVYLLSLILSETLRLCTLLAYFPSPDSCVHSCQQKLHSLILICTNAPYYFGVLGAWWVPSERGNDLSEELFSASDLMWCEIVKTTAREVCGVLSHYGELQREVFFYCSQNYKASADTLLKLFASLSKAAGVQTQTHGLL